MKINKCSDFKDINIHLKKFKLPAELLVSHKFNDLTNLDDDTSVLQSGIDKSTDDGSISPLANLRHV